MIYFLDGRKWNNPNAWGSTELLVNAYGLASRHVARSDMDRKEYRRAAIYDRHKAKIIRVYTRTATGISIIDYE